VRLDGPAAQVAAPGVGQEEVVLQVQERTQEHDDAAGPAGGVDVHVVEVEALGRDDLEVVVGVEPAGLHADAVEHLEDAVDLVDAGDLAQRRAPPVQQRRAQQGDPGVLRRLHVDRTRQDRAADDTEVHRRLATERDELVVEGLADAGEHLDAQVLATLLDAVDGALTGAEGLGQASLGEPTVLAGVADEGSDLAEVRLGTDGGFIRHVPTIISHVR
jgi:hypothetical protein